MILKENINKNSINNEQQKNKNHKLLTIIFSNTTILPSRTLWEGY